jgi:LacI family transcriptional regulator
MPTIKKIADLAGVSVATVSYVMNNRPDVSKDTRNRVMEIAKKINYVPSRGIRHHKTQNGKVKSLAFVSCLHRDPWGEPYWGQFLTGSLDASHHLNSVLQVARADSEANENSRMSIPVAIRERIADGLIVAGWPSKTFIESLAAYNIPMVLLDTREVFEGFSHVRPDHNGGTVKAVKYLHELGHRKIAVITGDMSFACESERLSAYYMAMTQLGLQWNEEWIIKQPRLHEQSGIDGMKEILRRKLDVTAIVCHGDWIARGAMTVAKENGFSVPGDFSIVGCDNQPWSEQTDPPLTTVDVSLVELGQLAVRQLLERIDNPKLSPQRITIEAKMVIRGSAGPMKK